ncbi:MAG: DUF4238 domain-containing protein [Rhizobiales bacterium]|nr:DUF4238 domain-containing protein [Hyphomicrobiales bacterium]
MSEARKHHYVPQLYLRQFTTGSRKQARTYVTDIVQRKTFATGSGNIAAERDFNRIEVDGLDPNSLENAYASFEAKAATALNRLIHLVDMPDGEDRLVIFNLMAMLAVRNPRFRMNISSFLDDVYRKVGKLVMGSEERWISVRQRMSDAGYTVPDNISYAQLKEFITSDEYDVVVPTTTLARFELPQYHLAIQTMMKRNWQIFISDENSGGFVTCDHPVNLIATDERLLGRPLGFGLPGTAVLFPLSPKIMIAGEFGGQSLRRKVDRAEVAVLNSHMIDGAVAQIYAADDRFPYMAPDQTIKAGSSLLDDLIHAEGNGRKGTRQ